MSNSDLVKVQGGMSNSDLVKVQGGMSNSDQDTCNTFSQNNTDYIS